MTFASDLYKFLESDQKTLLLTSAPDPLFKALEELKVKIDHDGSWDTNGWEWDWWVEAKYKKQKLQLSGSGFYGNAKIEKI